MLWDMFYDVDLKIDWTLGGISVTGTLVCKFGAIA